MALTVNVTESNSASTTSVSGSLGLGTGGAATIIGVNLAGRQAGNVGTAFQGIFGRVTVGADGNFRYDLDNSDPDTQLLSSGETAHERFIVTYQQAGQTRTLELDIAIAGLDEPGQPVETLSQTRLISSAMTIPSSGYLLSSADKGLVKAYSGQTESLANAGSIRVSGSAGPTLYGVQLSTADAGQGATIFRNDGRIAVTSAAAEVGLTAVISEGGTNNGVISAVQSSAANSAGYLIRAVGWNTSDAVNNGLVEAVSAGEAFGVWGTGDFTNTGVISVRGGKVTDPLGVIGYRSGTSVGDRFVNTGSISVISSSPDQKTVGLYFFPSNTNVYQPMWITNSGTIAADRAVLAIGGYNVSTNLSNSGRIEGTIEFDSGINVIENQVSGVIVGAVTTGPESDLITNGGTIIGDVDLGGGSDVFQAGGDGSVSGEVRGGDGADVLIGARPADRLAGNAGDDWLSGGGGADTLTGGSGRDTFSYLALSDSTAAARDSITDFETGVDRIDISALGAATVTLSSSGGQTIVNATTASGTLSIAVTGTIVPSDIVTLAGGNPLTGTSGNDILITRTSPVRITGEAGDDVLLGGAGNDTLDGGTGRDVMMGGAGDDTYYIDNDGDRIAELSGAGIDTVYTSVDYSLQANVENAVLLGSVPIGILGNDLPNVLTGNDAPNQLLGRGGADTLYGGGGSDYILPGGAPAGTVDRIIYRSTSESTGGNWDLIDNFVQGTAIIDLTALQPLSFSFQEFQISNLDLSLTNTFFYSGPQMPYPIYVNHWTRVLITASTGWMEIRVAGHVDVTDFLWNRAPGAVTQISGSPTNDLLRGTDGPDRVYTDSGDDSVYGGAGDDTMWGGTGINLIDGGDGTDTLDLSGVPSSYRVATVDGSTVVFGAGGYNRLASVEQVMLGGQVLSLAGFAQSTGSALGYTASYPDLIRAFGTDARAAAVHYRDFGAREGRTISFDPALYLAKYADLRAAFGTDKAAAETHFVAYGFAEGRSLNLDGNDVLTGSAGFDLFAAGAGDDTIDGAGGVNDLMGGEGTDTLVLSGRPADYAIGDYYGRTVIFGNGSWNVIQQIEQVRIDGTTYSLDAFRPLAGRALAYVASYPDLIAAVGTSELAAIQHYQGFGLAEGRRVVFDGNAYIAKYADVRAAYGSDIDAAIRHYMAWGRAEGRSADLSGNDSLTGSAGPDRLDGGPGNDLVTARAGDDTLIGGTGDDRLDGGPGINAIDGGAGADTLVLSGAGAYRVFSVNGALEVHGPGEIDQVVNVEQVEVGGGTVTWSSFAASPLDPLAYLASYPDVARAFGTDARAAAQHYVTYGLAEGRTILFDPQAYLAKYSDLRAAFGTDTRAASLHYMAFGAAEGRSSSLAGDDVLRGTGGADVLSGGSGNDALWGLGGADTLTGGPGRDTFVFSTAPTANAVARVTDFVPGTDRIQLSGPGFAAAGPAGPLGVDAFWAGPGVTAAHDASDRLVFNTSTGDLYLDPDGTGPGTAVLFAQLPGLTTSLASTDFFVV